MSTGQRITTSSGNLHAGLKKSLAFHFIFSASRIRETSFFTIIFTIFFISKCFIKKHKMGATPVHGKYTKGTPTIKQRNYNN